MPRVFIKQESEVIDEGRKDYGDSSKRPSGVSSYSGHAGTDSSELQEPTDPHAHAVVD